MHDYLQKIIDHKKREIDLLEKLLVEDPQHPIHDYVTKKNKRSARKSLKASLRQKGLSIIGEIKRRSPAKNHLAEIIDPVSLALTYEKAGVSAISVLTDQTGFGGSLEDLQAVAEHVSVPVLRKDFILEAVQIAEAIVNGADAILLIVSVLGEKTASLLQVAYEMGIEALVEVHDCQELEYVLTLAPEIIGINNRNLTTFAVDTQNALQLKPLIPHEIVTVAESGIQNLLDVQQCVQAGFDAVLIGEALVKAADPAQLIRQWSQV